MSGHIPADLDRKVRQRARDCCEYCRLSQKWQEATFHVDHVIPRAAGGKTTLANLALACVSCSLRKAARLSADDPRSGTAVWLFNPRHDTWNDHFQLTRACRLQGLTATGRATINALGMNRSAIVAIRRQLRSFESETR